MDIEKNIADISSKAMDTGIPQKISRGASALQQSLEGDTSDIRSLFTDPRSGRFSVPIASRAAVQSLSTQPHVQKYLDKFLESNYGQLLPVLADNPNINMALAKVPFAGTAVRTAMDRLSMKRFEALKANALRNAGAMSGSIADKYEELSQKKSGQDLAGEVLKRYTRLAPGGGIDEAEFVIRAKKLARYRQGRELTAAEKAAVRKAAADIKKRSYDVKGIAAVYEHLPGGLAGQRYRTAEAESGRIRETTGAKLEDTGKALTEAQTKVKEIMDTKGPERRAKGTYVNIKKLKDAFVESGTKKSASYSDISHMFNNLVDKLAADEYPTTGLIDSLSSSEFNKRYSTRPKVVERKSFKDPGEVTDYVNSKLYKGSTEEDAQKHLLRNIFKKLKKELYFKDDITYTDTV